MGVKAQVRDLCYISGNLYSNCIIRHMRMKWTDHPPGICGWDVGMALKGLDIRKCMSSGLASCMFTIQYISIIFCCLLFMSYYWIKLEDLLMYLSLSVMRCISAELFHACQTVGVLIGKWFPNQATTDNTASYVGLTEIGSSYEI